MTTILGVSASLRNARFGAGSLELVEQIRSLGSLQELRDFLGREAQSQVQAFVEAGRVEGLPFDKIYENFRRRPGLQGLSNSEIALAAGLWGAVQEGANIRHVGLAEFFPAAGPHRDLERLRREILGSDAILLSGPVYFGDRGSLAQDFIELIRNSPELRGHCEGKVYGGITVGAKRNGGQETTLIYQMVDMTNLGMLAVGNDSETTAQYGGTVVAGDVGTAPTDGYGLETSIGTGRRVARVARMLASSRCHRLVDPLRVGVWWLQDDERATGRDMLRDLIAQVPDDLAEFHVIDFTEGTPWDIVRCIACDICPEEMGLDSDYRCVIGRPRDLLKVHHASMVDVDALLVGAYSPIERGVETSVYQKLVERTRYFRHSDYILSDILVAPLVLTELGSNQNLHIRMMTSMLRHHTVMNRPLIGWRHRGEWLRRETLAADLEAFVERGRVLRTGWLAQARQDSASFAYNPVGFKIGADILEVDKVRAAQQAGLRERRERRETDAMRRLDDAGQPATNGAQAFGTPAD